MTQRLIPEERFTVSRDGGELVYYRYGPASSKNILAIHGISASNRTWQCFARTATKNGYAVYAVDLRGRGNSNTIKGPWGMRTHALDMVAVMDHAGLTTCDVVGHSMGGFVVAALLSVAPERVVKATLVDGGVPFPVPADMTLEELLPKVLGPALARLARTFKDLDEYRDYWKAHPAFVRGWTEVTQEYSDYDLRGPSGAMHASTLPEAFTADSRELFQGDSRDLIDGALRGLDREVLLIRAPRGLMNEEPPLYPSGIIETRLQQYPKVKMVTLDDVNHYDILLEQSCSDRCIKLAYPDMSI